MDSNHRRRKPADLQSAPFGHSGNYPSFLGNLIYCLEVVPKTECKSTANFAKHQIFGELFPCNAYKNKEWVTFLRTYPKSGSINWGGRIKPVLKCHSQYWIFMKSHYWRLGAFWLLRPNIRTDRFFYSKDFMKSTILMAVMANSRPLSILAPARSSACASLLTVSTPLIMGIFPVALSCTSPAVVPWQI